MADGRVVIITGANSGIGKAAAVRFARAGDTVVMACRDLARSTSSWTFVREAAGGADVSLEAVDVSSLRSVRDFTERIAQRFSRVDLLIHNAGYFEHGLRTVQRSAEGLELTFATNVFGPLLMTQRLQPLLERSDDARVLFAGSTNLKNFLDPQRTLMFEQLSGEAPWDASYSVYRMYGDSKMAVLLLTYRLAREWKECGIKTYCVQIPVVRVERHVLKKFSGIFALLGPLINRYNPFAMSREAMAESYFHICSADELRSESGVLVDPSGRILARPTSDRPLAPHRVLRELLCGSTQAPPYAGSTDHEERLWFLAQGVLREHTEEGGGGGSDWSPS